MSESPASPLEAPSLEEIQNSLLSEMTKLCGLLVESKNPSPRLKEAEEIIAALPARFEADRAYSAAKNQAVELSMARQTLQLNHLGNRAAALAALSREIVTELTAKLAALPKPQPVEPKKPAPPPVKPVVKEIKLLSAAELRLQVLRQFKEPIPGMRVSGNIWENWDVAPPQ